MHLQVPTANSNGNDVDGLNASGGGGDRFSLASWAAGGATATGTEASWGATTAAEFKREEAYNFREEIKLMKNVDHP